MGLQRKQGVQANEQIDIRRTVEQFKQAVNMYTLWKPGMVIHVLHVKRRNIPNFVFPGGVRPTRPSKVSWQSRPGSELKGSSPAQPDKLWESKTVLDGSDDGRKRKRVDDDVDTNSINLKSVPSNGEVYVSSPPISTVSSSSVKCENMDASKSVESQREKSDYSMPDSLRKFEDPAEVSFQNGETEVSSRCDPPTKSFLAAVADTSSTKEAETLAIENIMSGPFATHQSFTEELEELEDDVEYINQVKDSAESMKGNQVESSKPTSVAVPVTCNAATGPSTGSYLTGGLEELEEVNPLTFVSAYKFVLPVLLIDVLCSV